MASDRASRERHLPELNLTKEVRGFDCERHNNGMHPTANSAALIRETLF